MKRRRNAPISKRDKKALKRILRSHKGRGNSCRNPKRYSRQKRKAAKKHGTSRRRYAAKASAAAHRGLRTKLMSRRDRHHRRTAYRWAGKAQSQHTRAEVMAYRMCNPKRYSRQKRKSTKGRSLAKFKRALTRKLHHQGSGKHFQRSRRFSKWFTGAARAGQRVTRDAVGRNRSRREMIKAWRALPESRTNPKRGGKGKKHGRKSRRVKFDRSEGTHNFYGRQLERARSKASAHGRGRKSNPKRAKGRKTRRHGARYTVAAHKGKQFFQVTGRWKDARRFARPFSKKRGWKSNRRSIVLTWNKRDDQRSFDRRGRWRKPPF